MMWASVSETASKFALEEVEMKSFCSIAVVAACLMAGPVAYAQQASAPAGSTGQCKDGSYTNHATKRGSCAGHKGVKEWYSATPATEAAPAAGAGAVAAPAAIPAATTMPAAATPKTPTAAPMTTTKAATGMPTAAAPGGGAGMVWVNTSSKAYHCQNDKWYGKTKKGEYMSEADAKAKGYHGDHGKSCTQ